MSHDTAAVLLDLMAHQFVVGVHCPLTAWALRHGMSKEPQLPVTVNTSWTEEVSCDVDK